MKFKGYIVEVWIEDDFYPVRPNDDQQEGVTLETCVWGRFVWTHVSPEELTERIEDYRLADHKATIGAEDRAYRIFDARMEIDDKPSVCYEGE